MRKGKEERRGVLFGAGCQSPEGGGIRARSRATGQANGGAGDGRKHGSAGRHARSTARHTDGWRGGEAGGLAGWRAAMRRTRRCAEWAAGAGARERGGEWLWDWVGQNEEMKAGESKTWERKRDGER